MTEVHRCKQCLFGPDATLCIVALGTSTCCQLKVFFLPSDRKGLLRHIVDNKVSTLARLTFYENLLIGPETSVRFPH